MEEEGADVDGVELDGAKWEGGATESDCRDLNCASLRLMVVASMAHMIEKWVEEGKRTKKLRKILVIAKGKMSLSFLPLSRRFYTIFLSIFLCLTTSLIFVS